MVRVRSPRYGRKLDDFTVGAVYAHPWDVTVDEGMLALFAASFQDAIPTYASRVAARSVGLRDRPVSPLLLLNLGISFSVHDVSEQAIAHLAYTDVRFPAACYPGDTLRASSLVIGKKPVSTGDKGVVHVRTQVVNQDGLLVCSFERKALVPPGRVAERPADAPHAVAQPDAQPARLPKELDGPLPPPARQGGFACAWDDFEVGDVITHEVGRTIGDSEHMQLATLLRNSHPLHVDEQYSRSSSFAKTRVVHGGLVLSWVLALSSRDTAGCGVWDLGLDEGAHPSGVLAGDTLFAASKVIAREEAKSGAGSVTFRIVGVKNMPPRALIEQGADLFTPELGKSEGRVKEKVVEITRTLLLRRRS